MNQYTIDLTCGFGAWQQGTADNTKLLKALAYFAMFGKDVQIQSTPLGLSTQAAGGTTEPIVNPSKIDNGAEGYLWYCGTITAKFDFSLSNIQTFWDTALTNGNAIAVVAAFQNAYDSSKQSVKEMVDKPYPMKGYLAVVVTDGSKAVDPTKDLDNYIALTCYSRGGGGNNYETIYIGRCNSSKTDFYTPFDTLDAVFFDDSSK